MAALPDLLSAILASAKGSTPAERRFQLQHLPRQLQIKVLSNLLAPLTRQANKVDGSVLSEEDLWPVAIRCLRSSNTYQVSQCRVLSKALVCAGVALSVKAAQSLLSALSATFSALEKQRKQGNTAPVGARRYALASAVEVCALAATMANPSLLHCILYHSDLVEEIGRSGYLGQSGDLSVLQSAVSFFSKKVDALGWDPGLRQVQAAISASAGQWSELLSVHPPAPLDFGVEVHEGGHVYVTAFGDPNQIHFAFGCSPRSGEDCLTDKKEEQGAAESPSGLLCDIV